MISPTDLWKTVGGSVGQHPRHWQELESAQEFINHLGEKLNVGKSDILKTTRGRYHGGTWAHWQIALAYAKHLSPELHMYANEAFKGFMTAEVKMTADMVDRTVARYDVVDIDDARRALEIMRASLVKPQDE